MDILDQRFIHQRPFYVLPLIMGISMFIQQKLNPAPPGSNAGQKIMMSLPFVFTVFFAFFLPDWFSIG